MKPLKKLFITAACGCTITATALTPFSGKFFNADGTPLTNQILLQAYPPVANGVTIYGTNVIFGNKIITNNPDVTGFFTNAAYPNQYSVTFVGLNTTAYAVIPDTATTQPLAMYITNAPVVGGAGGLSGFMYLTNLLGYTPATNGGTLAYSQLPFTPATNNYAGVTNALGFAPATNIAFSLTGTFTYTNGSGSRSTFYITNGIVITNTTP